MRRFWKRHRRVMRGILFLMVLLAVWFAIPRPALQSDALTEDGLSSVVYNAGFRLHFSQPMVAASVEENFSVYPSLKGVFRWPDRRTLEFVPESPLEIGDEYRVRVRASARNIFMKTLPEGAELFYRVTGSPFVAFVFPEASDGPTYVNEYDPITVLFDRPMDLEKINADKPALLNIEPRVAGRIDWVGDRAFRFFPDAWPMGNTLTLEIPRNLPAKDGGLTEAPYAWALETPAPEIIMTSPESEDIFVNAEAEIHLVFNQVMDLDMIQPGNNVLLFPSNDLDANANPRTDGFFNTDVTYKTLPDGSTDRRSLIFKPSFPYQFNQEYRLVAKEGLSGKAGAKGLQKDFELRFKTSPKPSLPVADFADKKLVLTFSTPMSAETLQSHARLQPEAPLKEMNLSGDNTVATFSYEVTPGVDYEFYFTEGLSDYSGNALPEDFKVTFTGEPLVPRIHFSGTERAHFYPLGSPVSVDVALTNASKITAEICAFSDAQFSQWVINPHDALRPCARSESIAFELDGALNKAELLTLNLQDHFSANFDAGAYILTLTSEGVKAQYPFLVGDFLLLAKKDSSGLLVWAVDFKNGTPLSNIDLTIYGSDGRSLAGGQTNENGLYYKKDGYADAVMVAAKKGNASTYAVFGWDVGWDPVLSGITGDYRGKGDYQLLVFLNDHSVKPGEVIFYRGWQRNAVFQSLAVTVHDAFGNVILVNPVLIYRDGSFAGEVRLPGDLPSGQYTVRFSSNQEEVALHEQVIWVLEGSDSPEPVVYDPPLVLNEPFYAFGSPNNQKGQYLIGLTTRERFIESDIISVDVIATDFYGKRLAGKNIKVELLNDSRVMTGLDVVSAEDPVSARLNLPKNGHIFMVRATAADEKGKAIRSELEFYRRDKIAELSTDDSSLKLIPEFPVYYVGGKARLLIHSPYKQGGLVFLTVEQEGIVDYRVISLESSAGFFEIPIRAEMAPNIHVSAVMVAPTGDALMNPKVLTAWATIRALPQDQAITVDVQIQPNQAGDHYLKIRTRDYQNRPLPSTLSVWVGPKDSLAHLYSPAMHFYKTIMTQVAGFMNLTPRFDLLAQENFDSGITDQPAYVPASSNAESSFGFILPAVSTDQGGYAEQAIELPSGFGVADIVVIASASQDQFGYGFSRMLEAASVILKPEAPHFARSGDEFNVTIQAQNHSEISKEIEIKLVSEWLQIQGGESRHLVLGPGEFKLAAFPVKVMPVTAPISSDIFIESNVIKTRLPIELSPSANNLLGGLWARSAQTVQLLYGLLDQPGPIITALFATQNSLDDSEKLLHVLIGFAQDANQAVFDRLVALWALGEYEQYDTALALRLFEARAPMMTREKGLLLLIFSDLLEAGQKSLEPYAGRLQAELASEAITDEDLVYFDVNDGLLTQSIVLAAFTRMGADNVLTPGMQMYLKKSLQKLVNPSYLEVFWIYKAFAGEVSDFDMTRYKAPSNLILAEQTLHPQAGTSVNLFKVGEVVELKTILILPEEIQNAVVRVHVPAGFVFSDSTPNDTWTIRIDDSKKGSIYWVAKSAPRGIYELEISLSAKFLGRFVQSSPEVIHALVPRWLGGNTLSVIEIKN